MMDGWTMGTNDLGAVSRRTLKSPIDCVGVGLHGGQKVNMRLVPAAPGAGIVFFRTDLNAALPARFDWVVDTRLCTVIGHPSDPQLRVGTVEHVLAALSASGVDDVLIELDGPEIPILDGSAAAFLFLIHCAGTIAHGGMREMLHIARTVRVEQGESFAELRPGAPGDHGFDMALSIDFPAQAIGRQALHLRLTPESFAAELAQARTFTMAAEIAALREAGLAQGGSLDNAIVVDDHKILNENGLRWKDEFVRHKLLDVVGDLALAGAPIAGRFIASRTGHALNNKLLRALFADQANIHRSLPTLAPMALSA
jgi:UDP-3-O-[3-hydroxymyristoyl] N-acetylglucosamine deacetylase